MVTKRIQKTIGILLAFLFIVTVTVSTVSALNPQPEPPSPINTVGLHSHVHVLAMERSLDVLTTGAGILSVQGEKVTI
jgi:hypothetical protein